MTRRTFLKNAAAGVAAGTLAAPAIAQSQPTVNWRPVRVDEAYDSAQLYLASEGLTDRSKGVKRA